MRIDTTVQHHEFAEHDAPAGNWSREVKTIPAKWRRGLIDDVLISGTPRGRSFITAMAELVIADLLGGSTR